MKKAKSEKLDMVLALTRQRSLQILICVGLLYVVLVTVEIPFVFLSGFNALSQETLSRPQAQLQTGRDLQEKDAPARPHVTVSQDSDELAPTGVVEPRNVVSGLNFEKTWKTGVTGGFSELHKSAKVAWDVGRKFWDELQSGKPNVIGQKHENGWESCPHSVSLSGSEFLNRKRLMVLPCGLTLGSHITVVGKPRPAHAEHDPKISLLREGDEAVMVSQFHMELQGLRIVEGEEPPRILHLNPRLKGDWSGKPVIEQNTCYRMQWGTAQRCEGWKSKADEETGEFSDLVLAYVGGSL